MIYLGASDDILAKYQKIFPRHLAIEKEITEENRFGQGMHALPWFWRVDGVELGSGSAWMDECKYSNIRMMQVLIYCTSEVYRLAWLKAKARYDRWNEECQTVRAEMFWTTLWFGHQRNEWERRSIQSTKLGHQAYAAKQMDLWERFKTKAEHYFAGKMSAIN